MPLPSARRRAGFPPSARAPGLRLVWLRDGQDWPNRECSHFLRAGGITWHVQSCGHGPALLLIHGTGASTHSWRALMPLLAQDFTVIAPDLPGHGFTEAPARAQLSLPGMAAGIVALVDALGVRPAIAAGHSAGAAILARAVLDGGLAPRGLISLNGALLPFRGLPGHFFAPLARLFFAMPILPMIFSWRARDRATVERLIRNTGSMIDPEGIDFYARLMRSPGHVDAVLGMMANWDLDPLVRDLPRLRPPLAQIIGGADRAIPPSEAEAVRGVLPRAEIIMMPGLGHLAHEERPRETAEIIRRLARGWGVLAAKEGEG